MVKSSVKIKLKKSKRPGKKKGLPGGKQVELHKKQPSTKQKTVRVPVALLGWLESEAAQVPVSVPSAIVQILEKAYQAAQRAKKTA